CQRARADSTLVGGAINPANPLWPKLRAGHWCLSMATGGRGRLESERYCNQRLARLWLSGFEHDCAFPISSSDRACLADSDTADGHKRRCHRLPDRLQRDAGSGAGGIDSASTAWLLAILAPTASRYSNCAVASARDFGIS